MGDGFSALKRYPEKSLGLTCYDENDRKVQEWVEKLKSFPDRFILVKKPQDNCFLEWYQEMLVKYNIPHYLIMENPDRYVMQNRYQGDNNEEIFFFGNAHRINPHQTKVTFSKEITKGRFPWIWDPESGERYRIELNDHSLELALGPAESRLIVFTREKKGPKWNPAPETGPNVITLEGPWEAEFIHSREKQVKTMEMTSLQDLKDTEFVNFTGTVVYRKKFEPGGLNPVFLNLGQVYGVSEVFVNGKSCGVKWYGRRIYNITPWVLSGTNEIEIRVTTSMGNYMKTLTDNPTAQKFTVLKTKDQPLQSMGLAGPVTIY